MIGPAIDAAAAVSVGDPIEFSGLAAQRTRLRERIERAIAKVLAHGHYIMGPEVEELERRLASCASGADALMLALLALDVRSGDAVLIPSFTFAATADVVPWLDAVPLFVDVLEDALSIDPASVERGVATARRLGLKPVGVVAVDLFRPTGGLCGLEHGRHGAWALARCRRGTEFRRQLSPGSRRSDGQHHKTASFFPAKPLGCHGDGGAALTDDALWDAMATAARP